MTVQLCWTGQLMHMGDSRLSKTIFYSELQDGARWRGGQKKRYKDIMKGNLRKCDIQPDELEVL